MTNLLQGVVQHGTAVKAATIAVDWPLGGKTGTTDDFTDAWFIGFDPDITIGVWVGLRPEEVDSAPTCRAPRRAADLDRHHEDVGRSPPEASSRNVPDFARPTNVVIAMTDNGPEAFIAGTEPKGAGGGQLR